MMDAPVVLPAILLALVVSLFAASKLSRAGRIAPALKPIAGKPVEVQVWGTPVPGVRVHSVRAFSAALLLFLEPASGGKPVLLKVAQPGSARHDAHGVVIDDARYVQWNRARIRRVEGRPALELKVVAHDGE